MRQVSISQTFRGPLPPPEILARYNDALDNGAGRVFALAEGQAEHRQALERQSLSAEIGQKRLGLILGFVLAMVVVLGGVVLVALGKDVAGLAALITAVVSLVGLFINRERKRGAGERTDGGSLERAARRYAFSSGS